MGNLKRNKKAGYTGVKNEMLKVAKDTFMSHQIAMLFEIMFKKGSIPDEFNTGVVVTVIKDLNGCNKSIGNSRPITISEALSAIFESFILIKLEKNANLHKSQFGFRKFSSCSHAIFTFREACLKYKNENKALFVFFLDYSKAFDKINRSKIFYKLIDILPPQYWLTFFEYYENSFIRLETGKLEYTEKIKTTVGSKQGGIASPTVFNIAIDALLRELDQSGLTININGIPAGIIVYADDTTIICKCKKTARLALELIKRYCDLFDIQINETKTKWMGINTKSKGPFNLNGKKLEKVDEFKLLGFIITNNMSHKKHVMRRKSMCMMGIKEIEPLGFNSEHVPAKMKGLIYNSIGRSKLVYGLENVDMSEREAEKLQTFESNIIKRANGLSTRSRSTALIYAHNISPLLITIQKRKIGFILQLMTNEITRAILESTKCQTLNKTLYYLNYQFDNRE